MSCGYSKRGDPIDWNAKPASPTPQGTAIIEALKHVPQWCWVLIGGCLAILLTCVCASLSLSEEGLDRALFTTGLAIGGLIGFIVAEIWVFPKIAMDAHHLGVLDFFISHRFWHFAIQKLPRTKGPVVLLGWCITAIVGSLLLVGGLFYWLPGKHKGTFQLAAKQAKEHAALGASVRQDATIVRCVVLGYVPDKKEKLEGLVLGVPEGKDQLRYVGVVRRGISDINEKSLRTRLEPLKRLDPAIPGFELAVAVIWVEPQVYCEVSESTVGEAETLPNPLFKGLVLDSTTDKKETAEARQGP